LHNGETRDPTVEQESADPEVSGPAIERVEGGSGRQQTGPDQAADQIDAEAAQDGVEDVGAGRIPQFAQNEDRVVRPKGSAAGELPDVGKVNGEVAEIVRRLHFQLIAIDVEQPRE
jgi:hypothetical protein